MNIGAGQCCHITAGLLLTLIFAHQKMKSWLIAIVELEVVFDEREHVDRRSQILEWAEQTDQIDLGVQSHLCSYCWLNW